MAMNIIGFDSFMNGLKNYLKKYEFSNADQEDFWSSFAGYKQILTTVMPSYVDLPGYPLIYITMDIINKTHIMIKYGTFP